MAGNYLFSREIRINDRIRVLIPTVGEVMDNEEEYYNLVSLLTAMPIDLMVGLDDIGIDYTEIDEYQLFLMIFEQIKNSDTSLIFGDLDLKGFRLAKNNSTNMYIEYDQKNDITIDMAIHDQIATALRTIHHLEKNRRRPANGEAKRYMLERARKKMKRKAKEPYRSQLEPLIVSLVNTAEFKYDYEGTRDMTIYQFNESVLQIIRKINWDNRMIGVYIGTVNAKELRKDDLTWVRTA